MAQQAARHPPLLPNHTFVVQLHPSTEIAAGQVTGRIEHLVSRQATMFESLHTLLAFMAQVLREVHNATERGTDRIP
jgi:hypothetical protein